MVYTRDLPEQEKDTLLDESLWPDEYGADADDVFSAVMQEGMIAIIAAGPETAFAGIWLSGVLAGATAPEGWVEQMLEAFGDDDAKRVMRVTARRMRAGAKASQAAFAAAVADGRIKIEKDEYDLKEAE